MRILKIRWKNLNSLVGEWEIDLTHPAYTGDGLFALVGPTGSGKTTILDAICLALYGRTPRLEKVTKSGNEILSRHTGECFAEVTFETPQGRYRCHWSQRRARKKSDGELQAPKQEIVDDRTGTPLETKLRDVALSIEKLTGMDFERFTRSMLLAQGGFAAFLQASPDERAPILEQITGTEIYSRISMQVHQLAAEKRKAAELLQAEWSGIQLLSEEEEHKLRVEWEGGQTEGARLAQEGERLLRALQWCENLLQLEKELGTIRLAEQELKKEQLAFAPSLAQLKSAQRALELRGEWNALGQLRELLNQERSSHQKLMEQLPQVEQKRAEWERLQKAAQEKLDLVKKEEQERFPLFRQVRELDIKLRSREEQLEGARREFIELTKSKQSWEQQCAAWELEEKKLAQELQTLEAELVARAADERLVEQLEGVRARVEQLRNLQVKLDKQRAEQEQARLQIKKWEEQLAEKEQLFLSQNTQLKEQEALLSEKVQQSTVLLGEGGATSLQEQQLLRVKEESRLRQLLQEMKRWVSCAKQVKSATQQELTAQQEWQRASQALQEQDELRRARAREVLLLEQQLELLKKIEDLNALRLQLEDGQECPLCGSLEHPFAQGNVPVLDETQTGLRAAQLAQKEAQEKWEGLNQTVLQKQQERQRWGDARLNAVAQQGEGELHLQSLNQAAPQDEAEAAQWIERWEQELRECELHVRQLEERSQQVQLLAREQRELEEQVSALREQLTQTEKERERLLQQLSAEQKQAERLQLESEALAQQVEEERQSLSELVRTWGVTELILEGEGNSLALLTRRREQWLQKQERKTELERKQAVLLSQITQRQEQLQEREKDLERRKAEGLRLAEEQKELQAERQRLLGDKKVEEEEQALQGSKETAERELEQARKQSSLAGQELESLRGKRAQLEESLRGNEQREQQQTQLFLQQAQSLGFADVQAYQNACLPEEEYQRLRAEEQKLVQEELELQSQLKEKERSLARQRERALTQDSPESLREQWERAQQTQKELQQKLGALKQKLEENESQKLQKGAQQERLQASQRESARWERLRELIGSADGKKYRNFAQGLTFEVMVGHANQKLRKMSDRYLLVHDKRAPLELNVLDSYQAGEVRSTKNLSGGESFLVSLALALGLSQMASQNVRVDSLFLDEGFGTLDDDALDTALETLGSLQQDGKLIGVISHVPALKERISTQIQLEPLPGGRSRVRGPGCAQLS